MLNYKSYGSQPKIPQRVSSNWENLGGKNTKQANEKNFKNCLSSMRLRINTCGELFRRLLSWRQIDAISRRFPVLCAVFDDDVVRSHRRRSVGRNRRLGVGVDGIGGRWEGLVARTAWPRHHPVDDEDDERTEQKQNDDPVNNATVVRGKGLSRFVVFGCNA